MKPVGVAGVGLVSPAGPTLSHTWKALLEGRSSLGELPPDIKNVKPLVGHSVSDRRGTDHLFRMSLKAIGEAMPKGDFPRPTVLCLGSTTAGFRETERRETGLSYDPEWTSPSKLGTALAAAIGASEVYQFSQACSSAGYAIATACDLINGGYADVVIAGGADELVSCVIDAFSECRIYAPECKPFDIKRRGLVLGEAAAFTVLCRPDLLPQSARPCYVRGIGLTCDAAGDVSPSVDGILRAIEQAVGPKEPPHFIIAHATGTAVGDSVEAVAIRDSGLGTVPVSSFKGALGHSQGASGAVSFVLGVKSYLERQAFCTGGLVCLDSLSCPVNADFSLSEIRPDRVLSMTSGTWGVNSAILLGECPTGPTRLPFRVPFSGVAADADDSVLWPVTWSAAKKDGGRVHPYQFGRTVSNWRAGDLAIHLQLRGPQITLAYGDVHRVAQLQIDNNRAKGMYILDRFAAEMEGLGEL